ncbi:GntR family transcriptional regulator [Radicibacter daui]|uniref:GntR family transcriptional regulator n=1 Tax=Radicibacter daui TaxID=3064829 RepID=UPI004046EC21
MSQTVKALLELRDLILSGELPPGEKLSELPLVEKLGVSRTPLRMALVKLEAEGLVEVTANGGYAVRGFTETEIFDAIELRGTLEGMAARLAAERRPEGKRERLAEIRDCVGALDTLIRRHRLSGDDFYDYVRLNERFHTELIALSGSRVVQRAVDQIMTLPFASPNAFVFVQSELPESREILVIAQEHHRAIVEAVAAGEGTRAEALAREHSRVARRNLEIALNTRQGFERVPGASLFRLAAAV